MEQMRESTSRTIGALEAELQYLKTIKGANENLRDVRAKRRAMKLSGA